MNKSEYEKQRAKRVPPPVSMTEIESMFVKIGQVVIVLVLVFVFYFAFHDVFRFDWLALPMAIAATLALCGAFDKDPNA